MASLRLRRCSSSRPAEIWSTENEFGCSSNSGLDEVDSGLRRSERLASASGVNYSEISPKRKRIQRQSNTRERSASPAESGPPPLQLQSSDDESDDLNQLEATRRLRKHFYSSSTESSLESGWMEKNVENHQNFVCIRCKNEVFSSCADLFQHLRLKHRLGTKERAKRVLQKCIARSQEMFNHSKSGHVGSADDVNNNDVDSADIEEKVSNLNDVRNRDNEDTVDDVSNADKENSVGNFSNPDDEDVVDDVGYDERPRIRENASNDDNEDIVNDAERQSNVGNARNLNDINNLNDVNNLNEASNRDNARNGDNEKLSNRDGVNNGDKEDVVVNNVINTSRKSNVGNASNRDSNNNLSDVCNRDNEDVVVNNVINTSRMSNVANAGNTDNIVNHHDSRHIKCPYYKCDYVCGTKEELIGHGMDYHGFSFTFASRMAEIAVNT